jgi:hypothetical protein
LRPYITAPETACVNDSLHHYKKWVFFQKNSFPLFLEILLNGSLEHLACLVQ